MYIIMLINLFSNLEVMNEARVNILTVLASDFKNVNLTIKSTPRQACM